MTHPEQLLNDEGEMVVVLADGWTLRSGGAEGFTSGGYVRLVDPEGSEYLYWDATEWQDDPVLVMGAIINAAAGYRQTSPVCTCPPQTVELGAAHWITCPMHPENRGR